MTPEEQCIAIAKFCGWKPKKADKVLSMEHMCQSPSGVWGWIPEYCFDLNAMHEAEKALDDGREQWLLIKYQQILCDLCCDFPGTNVWHASASQRAEAFLKTIGKWKDEE